MQSFLIVEGNGELSFVDNSTNENKTVINLKSLWFTGATNLVIDPKQLEFKRQFLQIMS